MAKFEDYLQGSNLTWSNLSDATNKKIDAYEQTYEAYSNAYDAKDQALTSKYEKDLDRLDGEILEAIKKDEGANKPEIKKETPLQRVATETQTTPQTKPEQETKNAETKVEEVKQESKVETPKEETPKVEATETKTETPKEESGGKNYIGMFEV